MSLLHLSNNSVTTIITRPEIIMANGGFLSTNHDDGSAQVSTKSKHSKEVLVLSQGNYLEGGGIVRLNLVTNKATSLLDNRQGLQFNSPNDIVIHPQSGLMTGLIKASINGCVTVLLSQKSLKCLSTSLTIVFSFSRRHVLYRPVLRV